jgi:tetratricopeptide (TPR) repeat protein
MMRATRFAAALLAILAIAPLTVIAQPADVVEIHRQAVDFYVRTGDITHAVTPLQRWKSDDFDRAIAGLVASRDIARMKAAAVFHLDIGVALIGLNELSAKQHIDLGDHLLNKVRDSYQKTPEIKEFDALRAVYLGVAGSAFVAVRDVTLGMPYVREAHDLAPQSAHVVTVLGIAYEVDASGFNPEDWQTLSQRERSLREKVIRLGQAERAYREAMRLDGEYAIASIRLGRVLQLNGKLQEAREALERGAAQARGPFQEYIAALFLGGLLQELKDTAAARRSYERALAIVPASHPAIVGLAHLEVMSGRPDRAQELAQQLMNVSATDSWWAYKEGALDLPGLNWLRERIRQ